MFSAGYIPKNTLPKRSVSSRTISDYSPFGVLMPERSVNAGDFRYGFQGQEHDDQVKGEGNSVNFNYRMHDPRVGRFFAVDPLAAKYPHNSPYAFSENKVIHCVELEGLESVVYHYLNGFEISAPALTKSSQWIIIENSVSHNNCTASSSSIEWPSFAKANKYNTEHQNASFYTSVSERSAYYGWAQSQLTESSGKYWFKAAQVVTQWTGVGAAENINLGYLTDDAENLVLSGNRYLFSYNMFNAQSLIKNGKLSRTFTDALGNEKSFEGLIGKDLDYMLVEYEQTRVQEFMDLYQKNHPGFKMNSAIGSVNWSFDSFMGNEDVKTVLSEHFSDENGKNTFDFGKYEDRVKLGKELINVFREKDEKREGE